MVETIKDIKLQPYGSNYSGKQNGWAFQLLDDNYEGFHLGVCCKDFLQDIVWSELTQQSMTIHDQTSSYKGIIDKQSTLKLVMYPWLLNGLKEPVIENLEGLVDNLRAFLMEIEVLMGIDEFSNVECVNNKILFEFSKEWISKPYLFSMYTLLARIGLYYDGNLEEYIKKPFTPERQWLDNCDSYTLQSHGQKLIDIINNKAYIEYKDWKELKAGNEVHHKTGLFDSIENGKFKYKENVDQKES